MSLTFSGHHKTRTFSQHQTNAEMFHGTRDTIDWLSVSHFYVEELETADVWRLNVRCMTTGWLSSLFNSSGEQGVLLSPANGSTLLCAQQALTLNHGVRLNTLLQPSSPHSRRNNTKTLKHFSDTGSGECLTEEHMLTMLHLNLMTHFLLATKWILGISPVIDF